MRDDDIGSVIKVLRREKKGWDVPAVTLVAETTGDPFRVLISTIISLRTLDSTTAEVSRGLFALGRTPEELMEIPAKALEEAIYPAGFYRTKARQIKAICRRLVEEYGSRVPSELDELLTLPGVGRKTANLVVTLGYGKPGICVDTHVHRISNRLGYVSTKTPEQTETALRRKLPRRYWIELNDLLVAFGQHICRPVSPWCSTCPLERWCTRVGVGKSR